MLIFQSLPVEHGSIDVYQAAELTYCQCREKIARCKGAQGIADRKSTMPMHNLGAGSWMP
jgi:hypothetical protein